MVKKVTGYQGEEFGHVEGADKKKIKDLHKRAGSYDHEGTVKTGKIKSVVQTFGALKRKPR